MAIRIKNVLITQSAQYTLIHLVPMDVTDIEFPIKFLIPEETLSWRGRTRHRHRPTAGPRIWITPKIGIDRGMHK